MPEAIVQGNWGRNAKRLPPVVTDPQQVPIGTDLAGQTVQTNQGDYVMRGASSGATTPEVPFIRQGQTPPAIQPIRQPAIAATPSNPLINKGEPIKSPNAPDQQEVDIMVKKAKNETLTDDDLRFLAQKEITARAAVPTIQDIQNMTPDERLAYQQKGFQDTANQQLGQFDEFGQAQQDVYNKRIADAQAQMEAEKAAKEGQNAELLKAFEDEQRQAAEMSKQEVIEAGQEGMGTLQRSAARRGMTRSSATEGAIAKATANTQKLVSQIELATNSAVREYQVNLLDKLDQKMEKLQDRVTNLGDLAAEAELSNLKEKQKTYVDLMTQDPSNPQNMLELADKLANQQLEESKAMREEAMSVFENAIKYGFTPESLSEEQKNNIASSLGIKASELPSVINKALEKEANKDIDVEYQTDLDGNVTAIAYNKATGEIKTQNLGAIGKGQATRFQAVTDPITGQSRIFDPITGRFVDGGSGGGTPGYNLPATPGQPGKVVITATTENTPANLRSNCVFFARSIVPDLPVGLVTSDQKRNMANTTTPMAGAVAMMPSFGDPKIGHVAVVEQVNSDGTVTIVESNVRKSPTGGMAITRRTGTPQQLGISGYWASDKVKASNYTQPVQGKGEAANANNTYPENPPGRLSFENVLAKGGNVDFKQGYATYLAETGQSGSDAAYQDYTSRYYGAQAAGLDAAANKKESPFTSSGEIPIEIKTKLQADPSVKKMKASNDLNTTLKSYKELVEQTDGLVMEGTNKSILDAAYANLKIAYKNAAELGAITAPDVPLIEGAIKPATAAPWDLGANAMYNLAGGKEGVLGSLDMALQISNAKKTQAQNELRALYPEYADTTYFQTLTGGAAPGSAMIKVRYPDGEVYEMTPEDAAQAEQEGATRI